MIETKVLDKGLNLFHIKFQLKMIIESKVTMIFKTLVLGTKLLSKCGYHQK